LRRVTARAVARPRTVVVTRIELIPSGDFTLQFGFQTGPSGPGWDSLGVPFEDDEAILASTAITYADLRYWTTLFVTDKNALERLYGRLDRAEAAALAGNTDGEDKALAGYAALLDAGVFAWITRDRAEALQALLPAVQAL
jgi:hypothetical protein